MNIKNFRRSNNDSWIKKLRFFQSLWHLHKFVLRCAYIRTENYLHWNKAKSGSLVITARHYNFPIYCIDVWRNSDDKFHAPTYNAAHYIRRITRRSDYRRATHASLSSFYIYTFAWLSTLGNHRSARFYAGNPTYWWDKWEEWLFDLELLLASRGSIVI